MRKRRIIYLLFIAIFFSSCKEKKSTPNEAINFDNWKSYRNNIVKWQRSRLSEINKKEGWLNLAGLYWLENGRNSVGSDTSNIIQFPKGKGRNKIGELLLKNNEVWFSPREGVLIRDQKKMIKEPIRIFTQDTTIALFHQDLKWEIIKRKEKYGVRLWDLSLDNKLVRLPYFPINAKWRIKAHYNPDYFSNLRINTVIGQSYIHEKVGALEFKIANKNYTLAVLEERDSLFTLFSDSTNLGPTYPSGRFLKIAKPDSTGYTYIDFNKSYNPPCAFTPYATCPLPPEENKLPITIEAGEKDPNKI